MSSSTVQSETIKSWLYMYKAFMSVNEKWSNNL